MKVEVRLFATLTRFLPPGARDGAAILEIPDGSTLADVVRILHVPGTTDHVALVNGVDAGADRPLQSGDVVTLFPPLAGGSP